MASAVGIRTRGIEMTRPTRLAGSLTLVVALGLAIAVAGPATSSADAAAVSRTAPLAPTGVYISASDASSVTVTWTQPSAGIRPRVFRVYEGSTIVARSTTTHVTVGDLPLGASHTFTVTGVDRAGRESARSAQVVGQPSIGGLPPPPPFCYEAQGIVATAVTASAVSLSWSRLFGPVPLWVVGPGQPIRTSYLTARIGGLAPATTYTFSVNICFGVRPRSISVTTAAGPSARPGAPTAVRVQRRTPTTVGLSWTAPAGAAPAAGTPSTRAGSGSLRPSAPPRSSATSGPTPPRSSPWPPWTPTATSRCTANRCGSPHRCGDRESPSGNPVCRRPGVARILFERWLFHRHRPGAPLCPCPAELESDGATWS